LVQAIQDKRLQEPARMIPEQQFSIEECHRRNAKGVAMDSRNSEIYLSGSTVRSYAYICFAAILAALMVTFAVAPKARTQTTSEIRAGSWRAKTDDGRWVVVADDRMLREHNPGAEPAHPCFNYDGVLCLVPPNIGT